MVLRILETLVARLMQVLRERTAAAATHAIAQGIEDGLAKVVQELTSSVAGTPPPRLDSPAETKATPLTAAPETTHSINLPGPSAPPAKRGRGRPRKFQNYDTDRS